MGAVRLKAEPLSQPSDDDGTHHDRVHQQVGHQSDQDCLVEGIEG